MRIPSTRCKGLKLIVILAALGLSAVSHARTQATATRTVGGRVTDASRGTPVPRALVRLGSRSMLTDAQGRFSFAEFAEAQTFARVSKPGYTSSPAEAEGQATIKIMDLSVPIELKLYPEGLITGTVSGRDGLPLRGVGIQLYRASFDAAGSTSAQQGYTVSDARGQYRFQEPAGRYRIVTRYVSELEETGQAVLPERFPALGSSNTSSYFSLAGGQEGHFNLRPRSGLSEAVEVRLTGPVLSDDRLDARAMAETSVGVPFPVEMRHATTPGVFKLSLPAGAYRIEINADSRDQSLSGEGRLTVSARGSNLFEVKLVPAATFPVEVALDSVSRTPGLAVPWASSLGLSLRRTDGGVEGEGGIPAMVIGPNVSFRVPAGRYRLVSSNLSQWAVRSATMGASDLLTGELAVGGSAGSPIRLIVTSTSGVLNGTVQMGTAAGGWLYVIAHEPSLTPILMDRINLSGRVNRNVAPGAYTVLAVANPIQEDLRDPAVIQKLRSEGKEIEVAAGGKTAFALTLLGGDGGTP